MQAELVFFGVDHFDFEAETPGLAKGFSREGDSLAYAHDISGVFFDGEAVEKNTLTAFAVRDPKGQGMHPRLGALCHPPSYPGG